MLSKRNRLYLAILLAVLLGVALLMWRLLGDIDPRYRESAEESLVETAHLLAGLVEQQSPRVLDTSVLQALFPALREYIPNLNPPFRVIAETKGGTNPYFATGAGGILQAVLMGFGGLEITPKGLTQIKATLPTGWKSVTLTGIGVEKKTYIVK